MSNVLARMAIVACLPVAACSASEDGHAPLPSAPWATPAGHVVGGRLDVSTVADAASATAGDVIGYTITVAQSGKGAEKIVLTDTLPTNPGLAWSVEGGGSSCRIASNVLSCSFKLSGASSFSVHVVSPTTQSTCGAVDDQASVSANGGASITSTTAAIAIACPVHATSLAAASAAGDNNVKVVDPTILGTTAAAAISAGDTNIKVANVAAFCETTTAAAIAAGDTNVKVVSTADLHAGETLVIDFESVVVANIGTSGATGTGVSLTSPLSAAHAAGAGVTVPGQSVHVVIGSADESVTVVGVGTPGLGGTGLNLAAPVATPHPTGSPVHVPSMRIDSGASQETVTLTSIGTAGASGTGVSFTPPLSVAHPTGAIVIPLQ